MLAASPGLAVADCQCLANGRRYFQGEVACFKLPTGSQLARCDKVLNNSAWKKVSDGCPEANAAPEHLGNIVVQNGFVPALSAPRNAVDDEG